MTPNIWQALVNLYIFRVQMVFTCHVVGCRSGYKGENEKVSTFKARNDAELKLWNKVISRKDIKVSFKSRVCKLHFDKEDIIRGRYIAAEFYPFNPRLKADAIPKHHLGMCLELQFQMYMSINK